MRTFLPFLLLILPYFSNAQSYSDIVVRAGGGSGVLLKNNVTLTARHVVEQMQRGIGMTDDAICCADNPPLIGNYDLYKLLYMPKASSSDKKSLSSGKINFNELDTYNDWAVIELVYANKINSIDTIDPESLVPGAPLVLVGHLPPNDEKHVNTEVRLVSSNSKTVVFSYGSDSAFGRGFSGGGVFTPQGKLVAIIYAMNEIDRTGAATSIKHIERELKNSCTSLL